MSRITISILLFISGAAVSAQEQTDSLKTRRLDELVIEGQREIDVERLPPIEHRESGRVKRMKSSMLPISTRTSRIKQRVRFLLRFPVYLCTTWMAPGTKSTLQPEGWTHVDNNKVESVPEVISRNGLNIQHRKPVASL